VSETLSWCLWIGEEKERAIQTPDVEECVLDHVDRDAGVTTRQVGEELNILNMTISRVLREQVLYPYCVQFRASCLLILQCERTFDGGSTNC
jgi:hypothetical protein